MNCCIKKGKKKYYFASSDNWLTFSPIEESEFEPDKVSDGGNKRFVMLGKTIAVVTSNFWITYKLEKNVTKQDYNGVIDDSNNESVLRRYCKSDNEFIVTDDFWITFYFSQYSDGRVFDESKVMHKRITAIDHNTKLVETKNFYKDIKIIYILENPNEDINQNSKILREKSKEYKYYYDDNGTHPQKKCLCYLKYKYPVGKVLMLKLDELHYSEYLDDKTRKMNNGYGAEFEVFAMQRILQKDDVSNLIVFGSSDGKIDAIYLENDRLQMFQIKFITDMKPDHISKMNNICKLASSNTRYKELSNIKEYSDLVSFMTAHKDYLGHNYDMHVVSNDFRWSTKSENNKRTVLVGKKPITFYFHDSAELIYRYVDDYLLGRLGKRSLIIETFDLQYAKSEKTDDYFIFANADNFCHNISSAFSTSEEVDELFINNVRGYLGINEKMLDTIKNEPKNFTLFNNGVSICCEKVEGVNNDDNRFIIDKPFIVNGQQTVLTLYYAYKNNYDLKNVEVPLFIKPYKNDVNLMPKIAEYNNTQTPVKEIDLLCGNMNVRNISKRIYEIDVAKHGHKYEKWLSLKMFSTGKNTKIKLSSIIIPEENIIAINDYFKILLPILFRNKAEKNNLDVDMHLNSFNKNTTKYRDLYLQLDDEINLLLDKNDDFYYRVALAAKEAKDFVKMNINYLPAENLFGIALFYGVDCSEFSKELTKINFDSQNDTKKKIALLTKKETCDSLQDYYLSLEDK